MRPHMKLPMLALLLLAGSPGCGWESEKSPYGPKPDDSGEGEGEGETGCESTHSYYQDADEDGVGTGDVRVEACEAPEGYTTTKGDCDDTNPDVYTGADDACGDGLDADCDGTDEACPAESTLGGAETRLYGSGRNADTGRHMDVGDIDGDGHEDLVVGEMWVDSYQGGAWVVYGPVEGDQDIGDVGLEISGGSGAFEGGRSIGVGDVTGDGYDDVLLGSPDATAYDAVLIFGPLSADISFADADVRAFCTTAVECGHGSDVADLDGDGIMDAIIGAGEEVVEGASRGAVYLLFGPLEDREVNLQTSADAELAGTSAGAEAGRAISAGGDINGDGIGDLLVTSGDDSDGGPSAGAVFVVLAPVTASMSLADYDGKLIGGSAYSYAGEALAMGDISGDGLADAVVGAYASSGGDGAAAVLFNPLGEEINLSAADCIIDGESNEAMGSSVAARDSDGDGMAELLVGASGSSRADRSAGAAYLYYGSCGGTVTGDDADLTLTGEARRDAAGSGVGFGDMDADGRADLLIGATGESTGGTESGAVYIWGM